MRHLAEYRDAATVASLVRRIRARSGRPWRIMEVCGGQTHGLVRNGLVEALAGAVEFLHGPGCPVCVTPAEVIDRACALAGEPNTVVASYGDMLRVPGSQHSLWQARARGAQVRVLYSPLDAVTWAAKAPQTRHVVLAVGFETTAPATALAILQAAQLGLKNFQVLTAHVRVLPAMEQLLSVPGPAIEAFLAAGHVCTVTGFNAYADLVSRQQCPVVVTGFEPVDLLRGIEECVSNSKRAAVNWSIATTARFNPTEIPPPCDWSKKFSKWPTGSGVASAPFGQAACSCGTRIAPLRRFPAGLRWTRNPGGNAHWAPCCWGSCAPEIVRTSGIAALPKLRWAHP